MMFKQASVGTTQTQVIWLQLNRTSLAFFNNSANVIYIGEKDQGTGGFPIPAGGSISFKIPEDDVTGELWAIASGASSDLRIYEGYGGGF